MPKTSLLFSRQSLGWYIFELISFRLFILNFKTHVNPITCAAQFELKQVGNPENRFSNHKDHYLNSMIQLLYLSNFDRRITHAENVLAGQMMKQMMDVCIVQVCVK